MSGWTVMAIVSREMRSYFYSPLAWIIMTFFLLVQGYSFYLIMVLLTQPQAPHGSPFQLFFGGTIFYWLFVMMIISVITMGLVAEERRRGTLESVLTFPVTELELILGKFCAANIFYATLWLPTLIYVGILASLTAPQPVGQGAIVAGYLGTLLIGAACMAIGIFVSTLTRSQLVSALGTFTLLSLFLLLGPLEMYVRTPLARSLISYLNLFEHMEELSRGIIDSRRLFLYASLVVLFLAVATKTLELKKWRS